MQEVENVLRIFEETKIAIEKRDVVKLKELSNQTINTASRTQDPDNIATAVIIYSIGKILERESYKALPGWENFYKKLISSINNSVTDLKENNSEKFRQELESIRIAIGKLSGKLKAYIQDVFRKASINKASRIYEHGVSMEQTANLLGITLFELAGYAGQKQIYDIPESRTLGVKQRIKLAMEMFE
jgi:predicted RNA-binding protein